MGIRQKFFRKIKSRRYLQYVSVVICGFIISIYDMTSNGLVVYKQQLAKIILPLKAEMCNVINFIKFLDAKGEISQLVLENKKLKYKLDLLAEQNKKLTKFCKYPEHSDIGVSEVLGFEQNIFSSSIIIRVTNDVKVGYVVTSTDGLVGLVTSVAKNTAYVTTITDKRLAIPVKTKQGVHIVLSGTNRDVLTASAVQQNGLSIHIGDVLYTSGEGGVFPKDIPVATVIKTNPQIEAKPVVDLCNLDITLTEKPVNSNFLLDILR